MNNVEKLQSQLAAAQMQARSPINAVVVEAVAIPDVAKVALAAALEYSIVLQDNVRVIDANIKGLFSANIARTDGMLADIDLLNEKYLTEPNEEEAIKIKGYIESLIDQYGRDILKDASVNNAAYDALKKDRNVAVQALASHLNVVAALEVI